MKKYISYIVILILGIGLGFLFFSDTQDSDQKTEAHSQHDQVFTCSMHPQIRKHEPGQCPICGMDLIPVNQSGASDDEHNAISMTEHAMALADIKVTTVGKDSASQNSIQLSGQIKVNQDKLNVQPAYFAGRVESLVIKSEGEKIKRGQLLAKIYAPKLVSAQQELLTAAKNKIAQPDLYQAVRNKFKNWKISDRQIDQIESAGQVQRNFPVYAEQSGVVISKNVSQGDYIKEGQTLYTLASLDNVWAVFDAYENQLGQLQEGQPVTVTANAYPDKSWQTEISFIEPTLNPRQRTVDIRSELNNAQKLLKPGMFVKAQVEHKNSDRQQGSLTIPKTAVLWTGERSIVYVKTDENKPVFELREVKLGQETSNAYQILNGLEPGEKIVTKGTFNIDAAAQLQGKKSMMAQKPKQKNRRSVEFDNQFDKIITSYLKLKNELVNDQPDKAQKISKQLHTAIDQLEHVPDNLDRPLQRLGDLASTIAASANLKKQRDQFIDLSETLIQLLENASLSKPLFIQKCPMANNNKGARWISREKSIQNPYFGSQMLHCGSVVKVLKK